MADGKIVQCIGAVVDVEFPRNAMPKVYDALKMEGSELTLAKRNEGARAQAMWGLSRTLVNNMVTGVTTGYEALLRWEHPTRGLVPPVEFIPLAE